MQPAVHPRANTQLIISDTAQILVSLNPTRPMPYDISHSRHARTFFKILAPVADFQPFNLKP
jgi:hypothetical protein